MQKRAVKPHALAGHLSRRNADHASKATWRKLQLCNVNKLNCRIFCLGCASADAAASSTRAHHPRWLQQHQHGQPQAGGTQPGRCEESKSTY